MKLIPQTRIGIEIAGNDLRIAVLRAFAGKRRVLRTDVLTGFIALSEEDRVAQLAAYFNRHKLAGFNVHLTLPGTSGVTRDLEFPVSIGTGEALRSAVALQLENLSPWGLDEIYWDCAWEAPVKGHRSIIVHVGMVPRSVLDPWIALFRSTRLALTGASLSSLSCAHGVSVLWGSARPTMVFAAEDSYVEGTLVRDNRVYSVQMPGNDSSALVAASVAQLMRTGRVESAEQLRLLGHGAAVEETGLEPAPAHFGALSTALLGLTHTGFVVNLIPAALRHQRNYLQLLPTYALLALLALLALAAWLREPYQQSLYGQQLDREVRQLAVDVRSVGDQETKLNDISDRIRALDTLMRGRDANLEALRELSRVLPQTTWLTSYASQENVVTIGGYSESASSLQKVLEDSPVFRDVQFTSSITRDASNKDRFTLRAAIEVVQ